MTAVTGLADLRQPAGCDVHFGMNVMKRWLLPTNPEDFFHTVPAAKYPAIFFKLEHGNNRIYQPDAG